MKPTKTKWNVSKRPTKKTAAKKPAKRRNSPMVQKLLELKYRLNDAYHDRDIDTKSDKDFVMGLINNIRKREENPSKIQLEECNKIWRKYA